MTRGAGGPGDARGQGDSQRGWWGALQGGLGVCLIVASAAIGAIATMVTRSSPGFLLGLLVIAGTVAAALAVRPRSGWMILPVPVLAYLVAALISGFVFSRPAEPSMTALAIDATQWIANGFFFMALATVLAVAIIATRWCLWRRRRPARRDRGAPDPAPGPGRVGPRRPPRTWGTTSAESGYPAGIAGPAGPWEGGETGTAGWGDAGRRGRRPRRRPYPGRPGSGPYNFSSGA